MRNFLKEHSYDAVKMLVTQIAISLFGIVLTMACAVAKNDTLQVVCGVFAALFYLFLLYTSTWELGSKHHIPVEYGRKPNRPLLGLYIALLANIPNFFFAIGVALGKLFPVALEMIGTVCQWFCSFGQGMYSGILATPIGFYPNGDTLYLSHMWYVYFLTPLPALLICMIGYYFGLKNYKIFKFFDVKPAEHSESAKKNDENNDRH